MQKTFRSIKVNQLNENFFKAIGDEWMLITAGTRDSFNTMTAGWGTCGILWRRPVAVCFVRPQRYTFRFMEESSYFTLSFFEEEHRHILDYCGAKSGRNVDKIKETGLIPRFTEKGNIFFDQARLVLECRKMYSDHIKPDMFVIENIREEIYAVKDFHKFYVGEIIGCFIRVNES